MSRSPSRDSRQNTVPLGIVLLIIGLIILGTVVTVWIAMPSLMPQSVYLAANEFLPETAVNALFPSQTSSSPTTTISQTNSSVGKPTQIVIPQINLGAPISEISLEQVNDDGQTYHQWPVPNKFEAGWHDNSARLGETGNTVLNGHHNVYGEVFRNLIDLEKGDEIVLYDSRQAYTYQVTTKEILPERDESASTRIDNAEWIAPTDDERITLITCWPYTDNSHRLIIVAEPVE